MRVGYPPKYEIIVSSELTKDEFYKQSLIAFDKLKWQLTIKSPGTLKVSTKLNPMNFGEIFSVDYKDMKNIKLKSKSKFINIIDWGMNKSNVRVFWSYFSKNF